MSTIASLAGSLIGIISLIIIVARMAVGKPGHRLERQSFWWFYAWFSFLCLLFVPAAVLLFLFLLPDINTYQIHTIILATFTLLNVVGLISMIATMIKRAKIERAQGLSFISLKDL